MPELNDWSLVGRRAGYVAGGGFVAQSVLWLLDSTGALTPEVRFQDTPAGFQEDLATYYVALNERQHDVLWDIVVRDLIGPLAYVAVMVLVLALAHQVGRGKPRVELVLLLVVVGGASAAASDVVYLSQAQAWRGAFQPTPDIVGFGRAQELLGYVVNYLQYAGFVLLALAFGCLASWLLAHPGAYRWLAVLAAAESICLVTFVVTSVWPHDNVHLVAAAGAGIIVGPPVLVLLGRSAPGLATPAG